MSRTPKDKASSGPREAELRQALDKSGWRFTRQRAAVYDYLMSVHSHPTADEVYQFVKRKIDKLSLATVYKALEALVDAGLASKLADIDGPARYDCRTDDHYHLLCLETGEVRDLPIAYDASLIEKLDPKLTETLRRVGFRVTGHRLELIGHFENK